MKIKSLIVLVVLTCSAGASAFDVLGPFPPLGSVEAQVDFDQLMDFQKTRTAKQCEEAAAEADASLKAFFAGKKGPLTVQEIEKVQGKMRTVTLKAGAKILYYKKKFDRPRPYLTHPELKPCIELESSKAYPSGHATISRVYARILAVLFPERQFQILKRGDEVALNRVIGGVHHPSDVVAGKMLGDSIADEYLNSEFNYYQFIE